MHARLVEIEGIDSSRRQEVTTAIRERVIAQMKEREGFGGFISLYDPDGGRMRNVVLWQTPESADEWEREWASRREEMVRGFGGTLRSVDVYEVPIMETQAGARA